MRMNTETRMRDRAGCPLALTFLLGTLGSCGGGLTEDPGTQPASMLVNDVRAALGAEGIVALVAAPAIDDELFDLGQALYFDKLVSGNQDVSCATCHLTTEAGADGRTLPNGVGGLGIGPARSGGAIIARHSPTVLNTHLLDEMFWDGRVEFGGGGVLTSPAGADLTPAMIAVFDPGLELLAAQAMLPPVSRMEMRGDSGANGLADLADDDFDGVWAGIMDRLLVINAYENLFNAAYPTTLTADLDFAHAANAIAAFEVRAFARANSPFEAFVGGDDAALSTAQLEGTLEFFGSAGCARCHSGNLFTDEQYHNIALPQFGPGNGNGPGGNDDFGRENVSGNPVDRYRFRTPSLLNVALTAPYGHLGQYADLDDMVRHYRNAPQELQNYNIALEVDDTGLIGTLVNNTNQLIAGIDPLVANPRQFDVGHVVTFLGALSADSVADLAELVPSSVPSGLPLD